MIVFLPTLLLAEESTDKITKPSCATYRDVVDAGFSGLKHIEKPDWVKNRYTKITITPQKFTSPLLKYHINVFPTEKEFGNAYPLYTEALAEYKKVYNTSMEDCLKSKEYRDLDPTKDEKKIEQLKFSHFPLYRTNSNSEKNECSVTADVEADLYRSLEPTYKILEKASRRSYYLPENYEFNGAFTKMEYLQDARTLARFLQSKADWEIRNGKLDNAIKTIKTGLALSNHIFNTQPQYSGTISLLVASGIDIMMKQEILLLASQPDAPNLYPSLTQLPSRQDALLTVLHTELKYMFNLNRQSISLETYDKLDELSPEECKNIVEQMAHSLYWFGQSNVTINEEECKADEKQQRSRIMAAICTFSYVNAKERFLKRGVSVEEIDSLTVYQVVAPYLLEEVKRVFDLLFVWTTCKPGELHSDISFGRDKPEQELFHWLDFTNPVSILLALYASALELPKSALSRETQDWDKIKIVEAIRYYAAIHNKLPESLDDIKEIPVPKISPHTGKPYCYHVEGNTAFFDYRQRLGYKQVDGGQTDTTDTADSLDSRLEIILDK
jgi:hypothetical protein